MLFQTVNLRRKRGIVPDGHTVLKTMRTEIFFIQLKQAQRDVGTVVRDALKGCDEVREHKAQERGAFAPLQAVDVPGFDLDVQIVDDLF